MSNNSLGLIYTTRYKDAYCHVIYGNCHICAVLRDIPAFLHQRLQQSIGPLVAALIPLTCSEDTHAGGQSILGGVEEEQVKRILVTHGQFQQTP